MEEAPLTLNYEMKIDFKLETEINSDKNNSFIIIINADDYSYLNIKAIKKNDIFNKSFSNKYSVDEIKENKYFNMFDNLEEICNELSDRIKTKEIKLIENINNLIFSISLPVNKIKEITFELNEDKKSDKDKINDLNELIIKLKEEINEIKINHIKEINELKNINNKDINELKNIINNQNNEINEIKINHNKEINELKNINNNQNKEIKELKEQIKIWLNYKKNDLDNILNIKDSLIINNNNEYNKLINNWINPDKEIKVELLYRLSRDGDQISKFHELCDNKGPTLTLFETIEGYKGGIYTLLSWDNYSCWKNDMDTFIFNLNNRQKYKKIKNELSIYCKNTSGPWIANFGLSRMKKLEHGGSNINSYYDKGAEILPNNTSKLKYFDIKEVEIYKIIF